MQGWKRGKNYADFIFTLKPDHPDAADPFHRVFVVETKGLHLKEASDTEYRGRWRRIWDTRCPPAPAVTAAEVVSEPGADGVWSEGETVEAAVTFGSAVTVDTSNGTPTLARVQRDRFFADRPGPVDVMPNLTYTRNDGE